jgi:hypothetical protein
MTKKIVRLLFVVCSLLLIGSFECQAMPNFARKYGAECNMCHTVVPKLTRIGYEFRVAGYRLPDEIGKDEKPFHLGDFFAARIQEQYTYSHSSLATSTAPNQNSSQLQFLEFTMYPLTGSWGKYFGSITELSLAPGDIFEVENAYVRGVYGNSKDGWLQARLGIMHPWEGIGASDRGIGNIRPLFQTAFMKGTPFKLWNQDESALEVGYYYPRTGSNLNVAVLNGLFSHSEDGSIVNDPAQGGVFSKKNGDPAFNDKDVRVSFDQFITDNSSITLYYYHGAAAAPFDKAATLKTRDNFDRFAVYGNYFVIPQLNVLAGYEFGNDSLSDPTPASVTGSDVNINSNNVGHHQGFFGEVDVHPLKDKLALALRYDYLDPSTKVSGDTIQAGTFSVNWPLNNGLQFIADYQYKATQQPGTAPTQYNNLVQARMIFIY